MRLWNRGMKIFNTTIAALLQGNSAINKEAYTLQAVMLSSYSKIQKAKS